MRNPIRSFSQHVKRTFIFSLCLIALITLLGHIYVQVILEDNARLSQIIGLVERQRVNGQDIAHITELVAKETHNGHAARQAGSLNQLVNKWYRVQIGLQYGDVRIGTTTAKSEAADQLFESAEEPFKIIYYQAQKLVHPEKYSSDQLSEAVAVLLKNEPVYQKRMTAITLQYDKELREQIIYLQRIQFTLLGLLCIVLGLIGWFLYKPIIGKMQFYFSQLMDTTILTNELNLELEEKKQELEEQNQKLEEKTYESEQAQLKLEELFLKQRTLIAQKKKDAHKIEEKEKFIRSVTQAMPDVLYVFDLLELKYVFTNKQISNVLGYSTEEIQDMHGEFLTELIHTDDMPAVLSLHREVALARDNEIFPIEYRVRHKFGHYVWLHAQEMVFERDEQGIPILLMGVAKDITEQKQNLKALEVSEARYKALIETAEDIIYEMDADWNITYVNPVAERILGYSKNDFAKKRLWNIVKTEYRREMEDIYLREKETRSVIPYTEFPVRTKGGEEIWLGQNTTIEYDGDLVKTIRVIARDITGRKSAELELQQSELKYRSAVDNIAEAVFQIDREGKFIFLNPAWSLTTGFTVEESLGKLYTEFVHPDDRKLDMEHFQPVNRQECEFTKHQIRYLTKDGGYKWVEIYAQAVKSPKQRVQGVIGTITDISEQRNKEQRLIQAKEEAEDIALAKQNFLSMMSHEIRTPMNAVIGITHLLLQEDPRRDQIENLNILKFSADNLLVLINDILDYSKIEAGKINLEEVEFKLKDLIVSIEQSMLHKASEKDIDLDVFLEEGLPENVIGDPVRISQILNNLVSNAIKFTNRGLVRIEAKVNAVTEEYADIDFAVSDTGIGIPADKLEFIFESFTQASSDTTRKFGGTGLGLAITRRLLQMQGSDIQVTSVEGLGSKFYFTLRLKKGKAQQKRYLSAYTTNTFSDLSHIRLLLVEDNEINLLVATKFLSQWGIIPDYALNGVEAIEKIKTKQYHIVLMDLQMPEKDGYDATLEIRALEDPYFKKLPIIALTASVMSDVKSRLLEIGMNEYISKPFNPSELYGKILRFAEEVQDLEVEPHMPMIAAELVEDPSLVCFERLEELTTDSPDFKQELVEKCIEAVNELSAVYSEIMTEMSYVKLRRLEHKMRPTFHYFEPNELIAEIKRGLALLAVEKKDMEALHISAQRVEQLCLQIADELKAYLYEGNKQIAE
ncbi:PAS domain-containing hybrid sensor histidine kinase/response regulator [Xanthocytophaga flava]|uniref:PAS domain-containing hybrid sensor histidine kinase/response regulator n=1 Tax=Xanthocytophaga flava TaxID=3048013 RepID=UPI0028D42082|nr:PAS domain S-box protein [Xanthocytophaga flavus]MDJ1471422.1 PAS domain S-box protein [Xanthocytophaga flavus]